MTIDQSASGVNSLTNSPSTEERGGSDETREDDHCPQDVADGGLGPHGGYRPLNQGDGYQRPGVGVGG